VIWRHIDWRLHFPSPNCITKWFAKRLFDWPLSNLPKKWNGTNTNSNEHYLSEVATDGDVSAVDIGRRDTKSKEKEKIVDRGGVCTL
jgi:hypothetical protein